MSIWEYFNTVYWTPACERVSAGPSLVGVVRKDWASDNSIALSWTEVEQQPNVILDYEIKYYDKVQSYRPHLWNTLVL